MPAYVDTMAYVGAIPWHQEGVNLGEQNVDGATMQQAAGLDWTVGLAQLHLPDGRPVPGQFAPVCSDGEIIPAAVGGKYTPVQNAQLFETMEAMRGRGEVRFHTAGSLLERRRVWALAQVAGAIEVRRREGDRDVSAPYILGTSSHDGSANVTFALTTVRVVCWNTLNAALGEVRGKADTFTARHTASVLGRLEDAAEVLGLAVAATERMAGTLQGLANAPMARPAFVRLCAQLLSGEDNPEKAAEVIAKAEGRSAALYERKGGELLRLFESGRGNRGNCALDALNAVTEYVDYQLARTGTVDWDTAGASILWGAGAQLKARALALVAA